jgi:hypothetical protein
MCGYALYFFKLTVLLKLLKAELCVGKNKLAGEFPVETLEALFDLEVLNIGNNDFSGTIPDFFDHIHRLTELHLNNMKLKGSIPLSLGHLSAMSKLQENFMPFLFVNDIV